MPATATIRKAPGPRGGILLGCLPQFRRDAIGFLMRCAREYGDVVRFRIGPVTTHLINHPDLVGEVLVERAENFDKRTYSVSKIRATCGNSLLSSDGAAWQRHRRLIQPAFRPEALRASLPVVARQTEAMLSRWAAVARSGSTIDIVSEMMHLTLTIAARMLFGADVEEKAEVIERSLRVIMEDTWRRLETPFDLAMISPILHRPKFRRAVREIDAVVRQIFHDRHRQQTAQSDLLSMLLTAHEVPSDVPLSDRELRDAVMTLLLAGHETTANALAWTFCLVSQTPRVEQQLRDVTNREGPVAAQDSAACARRVFHEAIRLYPSVWILERRAVCAERIGGFRIPAGSTVVIAPYVLHRHPNFWDNPEEFLPERFAAENAGRTVRHAWIPFGLGAHACIGQHMATLIAEHVLRAVAQKFRLQIVPGQILRPRPGITLQHTAGVRTTLLANS